MCATIAFVISLAWHASLICFATTLQFAQMLPKLKFVPTEFNGHPNPMADPQEADKMLTSIAKTAEAAGVTNVLPAAFLDASDLSSWAGVPDYTLAAILCINVGGMRATVTCEIDWLINCLLALACSID